MDCERVHRYLGNSASSSVGKAGQSFPHAEALKKVVSTLYSSYTKQIRFFSHLKFPPKFTFKCWLSGNKPAALNKLYFFMLASFIST